MGGLPWVEQSMAAQMDPESIPQGLPEMPLILLEGDPVVLESPIQRSEQDSPARAGSASAVWLTGCDPRTLLLGWEEPSELSGSMASPTEWRLRSLAEPDSILATGSLPEDRRFLFLLDPPQAAGHIADIGVRSPEGRWKCLASSGPVSLPPSSVAAESSPAIAPPPSIAGIRPEVSASHFHEILEPQRRFVRPAGSSELGLPAVSGQLVQGATCGGSKRKRNRRSSGRAPAASMESGSVSDRSRHSVGEAIDPESSLGSSQPNSNVRGSHPVSQTADADPASAGESCPDSWIGNSRTTGSLSRRIRGISGSPWGMLSGSN